MIYTRTNNYGIDAKIKKIQTYLDAALSWNDTHIYGRLYSNQVSSSDGGVLGLKPEWHDGDGNYSDVFLNDNQSATIGFIKTEDDIKLKRATVDVIFTVNLDEVNSIDGRDDEKIKLEAIHYLKKSGLIQDVAEIREGIEDVFSGFYYDDYKFRDMQPHFNFALTCVIPYIDNICYGN